jgi:hypothetical protein
MVMAGEEKQAEIEPDNESDGVERIEALHAIFSNR